MSKNKDNTKKTPRQDFKVLVYPVKHTFNDAVGDEEPPHVKQGTGEE
jgi:hypothetical protein